MYVYVYISVVVYFWVMFNSLLFEIIFCIIISITSISVICIISSAIIIIIIVTAAIDIIILVIITIFIWHTYP